MRIVSAAIALLVMAAPVAAQEHAHDPSHMSNGTSMPAGWNVRLDKETAKLEDVKVMAMGKTLHVTTGPAAIMWQPAAVAKGNFSVGATFDLSKPAAHPEAYGIVFAGENLDKADQSYLYFIIRQDGKYMIKHRAGTETHTVTPWTENAAIVKPVEGGRSSNTLLVDVSDTQINYLVNGQQVASFERNNPMTAEGLVGVRINHNLDVHVKDFALKTK